MAKSLIIAEKNSVARDIAKSIGTFTQSNGFLTGESVLITWAVGHLVELHVEEAISGGKTLGSLPVIPTKFGLRAIERTANQYETIKSLMERQDVDTIINACDAGREGELIFTYIYELAGCKKPVKRMWLQSMTPASIREAYAHMRDGEAMRGLVDAAKSRSEADWLVGINGSRGSTGLYSMKSGAYKNTPVGRVQTPTLSIIVELEETIRNFVPEDFWELHGTFGLKAGQYSAKWVGQAGQKDSPEEGARFKRLEDAKSILNLCQGQQPSSVEDVSRVSVSAPPRLYDLTSLQRDANKRYRLSAKATLDAAQSLYERHKATSYPRTDSSALPEDYVESTKKIMQDLSAQEGYAQWSAKVMESGWIADHASDPKLFNNKKISDHFAIIPTGVEPQSLSPTESQIYDLVVRRFIAAFYPPAEYNKTERSTVLSGQLFRTSGRVLIKAGWKALYGADEDEDKEPTLCALERGEPAKVLSIELQAKKTRPPSRMTEADLLGAMENAGKLVEDEHLSELLKEKGLGTPATRAATIEGLLRDKGRTGKGIEVPIEPYMCREGREQFLVPTKKGIDLIHFLKENGLDDLTSPRMTGEWESKLGSIESGHLSRERFMIEIADMVRDMLEKIRHKAAESGWSKSNDREIGPSAAKEIIGAACPACGSPVLQSGKVCQCSKSCGFRIWTEISQRKLSEQEIITLLRDRKLSERDGFISTKSKPYSAGLVLQDDFRVALVFESPQETPLPDVDCPSCGEKTLNLVDGKYPKLSCSNEACSYTLWRNICGKVLNESQLRILLQGRVLPEIKGFVSPKTGNSFDAGLKLSPGDKTKIEFVFPERSKR